MRRGDSPAACNHLCCPADEAVLVSDYSEEPKYAAEVPQQTPGPAERSTDAAAAAAAPAGAEDGEGVPMGGGQPQVLVVGQDAGPAAVGGGKQQQKQGDAQHLDAMFAPPVAICVWWWLQVT